MLVLCTMKLLCYRVKFSYNFIIVKICIGKSPCVSYLKKLKLLFNFQHHLYENSLM
jgi:hypothetical protein